jgi:hypothetical protein
MVSVDTPKVLAGRDKKMEAAPVMFECLRIGGRLTLSEASCANQFKAAQDREWQYRLPHCVACPVGAKNAGVDAGAPFQQRMVCFRCGDGSGRIVMQRFCMSCYNREREWRVGANAKGRAPRDFKALGRFAFTCPSSGRRYVIEALCATEARLTAQKLWGLVDLVLDRRMSVLATQVTIFENPKVTRAKTPSVNSSPHNQLVDGPSNAAGGHAGRRSGV